ncbi:hypothetical protein RO3G_03686 [Rhizopus delemar RA 99-880]|uniref:Uncharacterized protein n=1 Tax=Rhizopus delemar (strain RA 99-880 / ATCC MYA-4621 / FGSC 9543 / NRRL 43880) TaxID=246409 RepID=I1BS01_RHIO9|nr:hypothetical protein RO3G_03686 [Rhizopus delemar RA 99-880]|eukprot:EIE78981.1 hypothetical protein RO3G_03686 [Rhizopus delemar RA 99-880]
MDNKLALALKHLGRLSCAITIGCSLIIWFKNFFYIPQFVLDVFRSDVYQGIFTMYWPVFYSNSLEKFDEPSRGK